MPVRSLSSSVKSWPDRAQVQAALHRQAERLGAARPEILRVGYIGSYARGDWGFGSDLDVIVILAQSERPFVERAANFDFTRLPVPVDVMACTREEWESLKQEAGQFYRTVKAEVAWVYRRAGH
jgi:predicted nucleotidyltransferase